MLCLCVLHVSGALAKPAKCKMDGVSYPPSLKPLPSGDAKNVTWEIVDLDAPAETRWSKVVAPRSQGINEMVDVILDSLITVLGNATVSKTLRALDGNLPKFYERLPLDLGGEIEGIAKSSGIDSAIVFMYNIFYTVFGACTSIVTQNQNGEIFHARNLDFGLWPKFDIKHRNFWLLNERLRPLVVNIDFQRGGKTVFKSTTFAGNYDVSVRWMVLSKNAPLLLFFS